MNEDIKAESEVYGEQVEPQDFLAALQQMAEKNEESGSAEGLFKDLFDSFNNSLIIKVKYCGSPQLQITNLGGCIDLYTAESVSLKAGEWALIPLGVAMELPKNYDAILLPRSSTFKKWGILLANSVGYIDNSYNGDDDQWMASVLATRDIEIPAETRCFQFRLVERQPHVRLLSVSSLGNDDRGGFGEGTKHLD